MGSIFTVLIALGLMQHPNIEDRRDGYVAPPANPWDSRFVVEKAVLLQQGLVILHDRNSTPLSRALGEDELIAAQGQPSAYERELDDTIRQYHAKIGTMHDLERMKR